MAERSYRLRLIDIIVVVMVVGVAVGLLLPAMSTGHFASHRAQCQNNMRNVGLALVQFETTKDQSPNAGTIFDDPSHHGGDPACSNIRRALTEPASFADEPDPLRHSWVVDISPYLDYQDLYNVWSQEEPYTSESRPGPTELSNATVASSSLSILRCPEDPTSQPDVGNLSYVVNGGFARWYADPIGWVGSNQDGKSSDGGTLRWAAEAGDWKGTLAVGKRLGVMFLGTQTGDQPWDIKTTPKDLIDGGSNTFLLGENTLAGYSKGTRYSGGLPSNWACPLPNFTMFLGSDDVCRSGRLETDCLAGQLRPTSTGATGEGWSRANSPGSFERVNGASGQLTVEGSFPFVNSGHVTGSNFVMCDGSVRFVSAKIDGKLYAELITPGGTALPGSLRQSQSADAFDEP